VIALRFPTRPRLFAGATAGIALLASVACGESSRPDFGGQVPEGAPRVDQHSLSFDPSELTVEAGEKVYFTNSESAVHKVDVNGEDVTGDMRRGAVAAYTFGAPGEYQLTCPYHPQMKATITVQ
jgi:plastocyanin